MDNEVGKHLNAADDPIKHVVVLMLENRSFDQMLGALTQVPHLSNLNGVDRSQPFSNTLKGEPPYLQAETRTVCIRPDPKHELKNVLRQIDCLSEYRPPREGTTGGLALRLDGDGKPPGHGMAF